MDEEHARSALRSALRALTTPVPVEWIQADRTTLALKPEQVWVDVRAFTALLSRAGSHQHDPDSVCEECAALYRQAEHAAPFRVGGQSCALVMTSRLNDVAGALAPTAEDVYRLPVLSESAGLELLGKLTPETVAQHPDETRELVRDLEGLPLAIHVAGRLLHAEARLGWGVGELLVELRQGASLLKAQPRVGAMSIAHISISGILIYLHDYLAAEAHAQEAVAICRRNGFVRGLQIALLSLAHAEKWLGKLESACLHYEEVLAESTSLPPSTLVNCLYGLGQARFRQGDLERAFTHFDEALKRARDGRILFRVCDVLPDIIALHLARNELDAARARLHELVAGAQQLGTPPFLVKALTAAVLLWRHLGKLEQAAEWAGLLQNYTQYLDPILFNTAIYKALETELGSEVYHDALERGKALELEKVLFEILTLLN